MKTFKKSFIVFILLLFTLPYAGTAQDKNVFWLHGFNGEAGIWEQYLERTFVQRRSIPHNPAYNTANGFTGSVNALQSGNGFLLQNQDPGRILIGHSMGGLVAREYERLRGQNFIGGIVTVATPNQGAAITRSLRTGQVAIAMNAAFDALIAGPQDDPNGFLFGAGIQTLFGDFDNAILELVNAPNSFGNVLVANFGATIATIIGTGGLLPASVVGPLIGRFTAELFFGLVDFGALIRGNEQSLIDMTPGSPALNRLNNRNTNVPIATIIAEEVNHASLRLAASAISPPEEQPFERATDHQVINVRAAVKRVYSSARVYNDAKKWLSPFRYNRFHTRARRWRRGQDYIEQQFFADYDRLIGAARTVQQTGTGTRLVCLTDRDTGPDIIPLEGTSDCMPQQFTFTFTRFILDISDGLVPKPAQEIEGIPPGDRYEAIGVNHLEVGNHPEMSDAFNDIFDRTDRLGVDSRR